MKTFFSFILAASVVALTGCTPAGETNSVANDTGRLDDMAGHNTQSAEFAHSVEQYYQAIEKKDWPTAYDMRTSDFKQDVTRSVYLKHMADSGETLTSYKVLNVLTYAGPSGSYTAGQIIMEFNEDGMVSYGCARWISQDGKWRCEEPGLSGLLTIRVPCWVPQ